MEMLFETVAIKTEETASVALEANKKIRKKLQIKTNPVPTFVIALAISKEEVDNSYRRISTSCGRPIQDGLHDMVRDHYEVNCADYMLLGKVPFSCSMAMEGITDWEQDIPLPQTVFESHLDSNTLAAFKVWRDKYPKSTHKIEFLQMIGCYR